MAHRQQGYRSPQNWPRRSSGERLWDDDERQSGSDRERERSQYGQYQESDEQEEGRMRYGGRRDTSEESGSTGRSAGYAGYGDFGQGDYDNPGRGANTGQGRYGQTGYGQGGYEKRGSGQENYGQANYSHGQPNYGGGDYGYGRGGQREFGGGRSRFGQDERYGYGYGGSGLRGSGSGYGSGNWYEPYGEGQQYGQGDQEYGQRGQQYVQRWGQPGQQSGQQFGGGQQYGSGQYGGSRYGLGEGPHRGKGPKGYQRSDERIKEMICERLREDPDIDASEVSVMVASGRVTLEGSVDHRTTKNAIEDVAEQLGLNEVQNNLRIHRPGQQEQMGKSTSMKSAMGSEDSETTRQKRN